MKRKLINLFWLLLLVPVSSFGQNVGINATGAPADASAALDISATDKGVLFPRLTTAQRDAISAPATGLFVYNTDDNCLQYFDGTNWSGCVGTVLKNEMDCSSITLGANPVVGDPLGASNTLSVDVVVNVLSPYTITTNTANGYSYSASGAFGSTGINTIVLQGSGTPVAQQTDNFTITMNGSSTTCVTSISAVTIRRSCKEYLAAGSTTDGVYTIDPDGAGGNAPVDCYCDMTTDGGGWTLVASSYGSFDDRAIPYHSELTTLSPTNNHNGLWDGMNPVVGANSDIRFSAKTTASASTFDVDLAFYACTWYPVLTASTSDASICFYDNNGNGTTHGIPARKDIVSGATLPAGNQWNIGYLEGEDSCNSTDDFTVDFDNRGMDSNQTDGTDWGEDDTTQKCGSVQGGTYYFFIWVRE